MMSVLLAVFFLLPEDVPVAFNYDGRDVRGLGGFEVRENTLSPTGGVLRVMVDDALSAVVEGRAEAEYGSVEYVMWLENIGAEATKDIRDVRSYCGTFRGAKLKFADAAAEYELADVDGGALRRVGGRELRDGLEIRLERPRSCKFLRIKRIQTTGRSLRNGAWNVSIYPFGEGMAYSVMGREYALEDGKRLGGISYSMVKVERKP